MSNLSECLCHGKCESCKNILVVILYKLPISLSCFGLHFIVLSTSKLLTVFDFCTTAEYNVRGLILVLVFLNLFQTCIAEKPKKINIIVIHRS